MSTRSRSPVTVIAAVAALLFAAGHLHAAPVVITTYDHDGSGLASGAGQDTAIQDHLRDEPVGNLDMIPVRHSGTTQTQLRNSVGYLRFDLSAVSNVPGATGATLQLYDHRFDEASLRQMDGKSFNLWALTEPTAAGWDEHTLTWNGDEGLGHTGAPAHQDDGTAFNGPDFTSDAALLSSFTFASLSDGDGWSTKMDFDSELLQFIKVQEALGNALITLMIERPQQVGREDTLYRIASKEADTVSNLSGTTVPLGSLAPRLELTGIVVAPTPTAGLMGLALLGILGAKRPRRVGPRRSAG